MEKRGSTLGKFPFGLIKIKPSFIDSRLLRLHYWADGAVRCDFRSYLLQLGSRPKG